MIAFVANLSLKKFPRNVKKKRILRFCGWQTYVVGKNKQLDGSKENIVPAFLSFMKYYYLDFDIKLEPEVNIFHDHFDHVVNSGKNRSSESCIQTRNVFKNVLAFIRSRQRIKIATYIATSGF